MTLASALATATGSSEKDNPWENNEKPEKNPNWPMSSLDFTTRWEWRMVTNRANKQYVPSIQSNAPELPTTNVGARTIHPHHLNLNKEGQLKPERQETTGKSMAKEDKKGKKKAMKEEMEQLEEEDRREMEEEYQQYLRFHKQEIAREPVPREMRGTKRPSSRVEEEQGTHKQQKAPQPNLKSWLSEARTPHGPWMEENDPAPGYLSDDAMKQLMDRKKKDSLMKPSTKKITETSRKMVTLIPCRMGGPGAYTPTLSWNSRVHGSEIPETPSMQEWIADLTAGMGIKPIHPDKRPPPVVRSPWYSDSDNDYNEDEEEPKYLRIHHNNPVLANMPQYKKDEQTHWLAVEKKKHDKSMRDKAVTHYYQVLTAWEQQPDIMTQYRQLELPPFIPLTPGNTMTNVKGSNHGAGLIRPARWVKHSHRYRDGHRQPGVVARPQWYTLHLEELNANPALPTIEISPLGDTFSRLEWEAHAANIEEDDVIQHLANNGVLQMMIDVAYPYGVTFLDFELLSGSFNLDYYSFVDEERHRLLNIYGVLMIPDEYAGCLSTSATQDQGPAIRLITGITSGNTTSTLGSQNALHPGLTCRLPHHTYCNIPMRTTLYVMANCLRTHLHVAVTGDHGNDEGPIIDPSEDNGFPVGNPNRGCVRGTDLIIYMRSSPLISRVGSLFTTTTYTHKTANGGLDSEGKPLGNERFNPRVLLLTIVLKLGGLETGVPQAGRMCSSNGDDTISSYAFEVYMVSKSVLSMANQGDLRPGTKSGHRQPPLGIKIRSQD
ncbi:hypothetical protein ARMGADRAFT_1022957 [Armillaria gallica]|uniref:Uncharacterized protein n=1 Tax=Armillaria gallica TaxID=47427 RepID=A0A2H3F1Y5_ARMGA|nr:hypothetical protein ARMGADRAFT_1022957 [Armillaria gallica]